jgi:carbon starvation protein
MNILVLLAIGLIVFYLGYRFYGNFMSGVFGEDDSKVTPAQRLQDGRDYVPTPLGVAFSHHFASIAGAGPIVGPTTALLFGFAPVWFWIILGTVFIGAVHDYTALFTSMREQGKSMAEVAKTSLGKLGFLLFIGFTVVMILLVTSSFLGLTAVSLTSLVPLKQMMISEGGAILKIATNAAGVECVKIGGIASTSVIIITCVAPLIGWLLYRRRVKVWKVSLLAVGVGLISISIGLCFPLALDPRIWMIILSIYVVIAAGIPVWLILQPRDLMNSFILYLGIALLLAGVVGGGLSGITTQAPAFNLAQGHLKLGTLWPFLFITVACGAISGFHSLVAGGTVSKQASKESDARKIGYGAMVLEGVMALVVLLCVASGLKFSAYLKIVWPTTPGVAANPILAFALSMGSLLHQALGLPVAFGTIFGILMVEGFVVTTLDTAVRLNRYLFEELWGILFKKVPAVMKSYLFNSLLAATLMLWLSWTNSFQIIWPIFGTANQLLAALTLIAVSVWLANRKKPTLFTLIPAIFMMATTFAALILLLKSQYLPNGNAPLIVTDLLLLLLALGVIYLSVRRLAFKSKSTAAGIDA